ncbi:hypothetical protein ACTJK9_22570 [Pseudomonas sp. 22082]|uniref:hypothetical protein n=1 Tax=Pseudomonas sp. 22082 TaxID=3453868 RepID=UPI003F8450FC
MESATKLISALAQILWPLLGFATLLIFKKEISEILRRIKKGKMLGQEIELTDSLENLRISAETVKDATIILPPPDAIESEKEVTNSEPDEIKIVLDEASRSPRVALITLGALIERAAKQALASTGILQPLSRISATEAVSKLSDRHGGLPGDVVNSMKLFMDVRNRIVHSREATEEDVISAIDSGITILRILKALPNRKLIVLHHNVAIFADSKCEEKHRGAGLILENVSPGGFEKSLIIFPTMQTNYQKGQLLAAEWDTKNVWNEAWYIDPDTNEKKSAWRSSGEFIGRPLESIYAPQTTAIQ